MTTTSKRETPEARAARAAQLLDSAEFQWAFESVRADIIAEMERLPLSEGNDSYAAQLIGQLQAAAKFKRELVRRVSVGERAIRRAERDNAPAPH